MDVYLYPPAIENRMPAFEITKTGGAGECRIYFSITKYNKITDINHLQLSLTYADSGASALNASQFTHQIKIYRRTTGQIILDNERAAISDYCYYIVLRDTDVSGGRFLAEKTYKAQIRLSSISPPDTTSPPNFGITRSWLSANLENFSEWSTGCLITPLFKPSVFIRGILQAEGFSASIYDILKISANRFDGVGDYAPGEPNSDEAIALTAAQWDNINSQEFKDRIGPLIADLTVFTGQDDGYGNFVFSGQYTSYNRSETLSTFSVQLFSPSNLLEPLAEVSNLKPDEVFYDGIKYNIDGSINYKYNPAELVTVFNTFHFSLDTIMENNTKYHLKFIYTTKNGFQGEQDFIFNTSFGDTYLDSSLSVRQIDSDSLGALGFRLSSQGHLTKNFLIVQRADNKDNFRAWKTIYSRPVPESSLIEETIYDHSVESGTLYKYLINNQTPDLNSGEPSTEPFFLPYTDMSLVGHSKQLSIQFNPEVSSFKYHVSDSKIETLGSKYPFVNRSSSTKYREIAISGLISSEMDEQQLFVTDSELFQQYSQLLKSHPYIAERLFREKVLDFLYDGEPKLFKSSTEGNMIVKLMDVSLTPEATLGRRLYSFSATLVEIADCSVENCKKYNIKMVSSVEAPSS